MIERREVSRDDELAERASHQGQPDASARMAQRRTLPSRQLWRRPAVELLALLQQDRVEVASDDDRVLIGDLLAALESRSLRQAE